MTNAIRYQTAKERAEAFREYCRVHKRCEGCVMRERYENPFECSFHWLDLEAPSEEPLPCPFCGAKTSAIEHPNTGYCWVMCENGECHYSAGYADSEDAAISAHNRVARAAAKEKEANK